MIPKAGPPPKTVDQILVELEEAMHTHLDSPVTGDLMSLTRAWREILSRCLSLPSLAGTAE